MENTLRQEIRQKLLDTKCPNIILELATGMGKTKLALDKLHQLFCQTHDMKILIVIPRNVLIQNWKEEFIKWGYSELLSHVTFTTYVSLPKHAGQWDTVVFDEAHHLSERCREALMTFSITHSIFLSATLKREHKEFIKYYSGNSVVFISVNTKKAINHDILPDPQILLIPLELDTKHQNIPLEKQKAKPGEKPFVIPYEQKWKFKNYKGALTYLCTLRQYYTEISNLIEWYKKKNYIPAMKNLWLHKCGVRLQWLSAIKLPYTMQIMAKVSSRYIVFCNTIAESEALKIPAVNSQVGFSNLDKFNKGQVSSLAAVNCLNEGINCTDCKVGIFNAINNSDIMQIQKVGRLLRHDSPTLIIPYFRNTREEEIVHKWMEGFNKDLIQIKTISSL